MSCIWEMKSVQPTLLMNARILHYTYDRGSLLFIMNPYICMLMLMTIYDTNLKA